MVPELDTSRIDHIIEKGQDKRVEMYSAFADPFVKHVSESKLESVLKEAGVTHVFCVGLAMDYCVRFTAMDAAKAGFKTVVINEGTKAVSPSDWEGVKAKLKDVGVEMVGLHGAEVEEVRKLSR